VKGTKAVLLLWLFAAAHLAAQQEFLYTSNFGGTVSAFSVAIAGP
jgi:hypothetical protein